MIVVVATVPIHARLGWQRNKVCRAISVDFRLEVKMSLAF